MKILLFGRKKAPREKIFPLISQVLDPGRIETFQTIEHFSRRLRQPREELEVIVFMAIGLNDLDDLLSIQDLTFDLPIILVLPDSEKETMTRAFKVYPRFISYIDGTFEDVRAIIKRMIQHFNDRERDEIRKREELSGMKN